MNTSADDRIVMEPDQHVLRFRLTLTAMIALLFLVPITVANVFDLDSRTPVTIAEDTLHDTYALRPVDENGKPIPEDSSAVTASEFSLEPGATTKNVPFFHHGHLVHCTIHAPTSDPASVTADCTD